MVVASSALPADLFARAIDAKDEITGSRRSAAVSKIAVGFALMGDYRQALAMAGRIESPFYAARALAEIAEELLEDGQVELCFSLQERAYITAKQTSDFGNGSREDVRIQLSTILAKIGKHEEAIQIARMIEAPIAQVQALAHVATVIALAGDLDKARQLAQRDIHTDRIEIGSAVAIAMARAGKQGEAVSLVEQVRRWVRVEQVDDYRARIALGMALAHTNIEHEITGLFPPPVVPARAFAVIARSLAHSEYLKETALDLVDESYRLTKEFEVSGRDQAFITISTAYTELGDITRAIKIADQIRIATFKDKIRPILVGALGLKQDYAAALNILEEIREPLDRVKALVALAVTQVPGRKNRTHRAELVPTLWSRF